MPTDIRTDAQVAEVSGAYRHSKRRTNVRGNGLPTDIETDAQVAEVTDAYRHRNRRTSGRGNGCLQTAEQTHQWQR